MIVKGIHKIIILLFVLALGNVNAQKNYTKRALYVDNFGNILGNSNKEQKLFKFAEEHNINEFILYDLHKINKQFHLGDTSKNHVLANFIKNAKTKYNIKEVSASGESGNFFIKAIHPYNVSRKDKNERFDVYNIEYEYWNKLASLEGGYYCETYLKNGQLPCNRKGSFKYFIQSLEIMRFLADELDHNIEVEAYIGNFQESEVNQISEHIDRLLIHDYVRRSERVFPYVKKRLELLEKINSKIKVSILYSSEMNFLGQYFKEHTLHEAEKKFFDSLRKQGDHLDDHINWHGFSYYNYDYLKYVTNFKH